MVRLVILLCVAALGALAPGGCAAKGTGAFRLPEADRALGFEAAKDALRSERFMLERVDAEQGIITTRDKASAGWGTPWDTQQTTLGQETADLLNQQYRRARVVFDPRAGRGEVEVTIYRVQTPGFRPSSKTWRTGTAAVDPALVAQGVGATYSVPVRRDARLEARLARAIERRAAGR